MADNDTTNTLNDTLQQLTTAIEGLNSSTESSIDPTTRLSKNLSNSSDIARSNISEIQYLRNQLVQNTNVGNMLKSSIQKADAINTKALGAGTTLQKIINQNSKAINESSVGYLRSAEAFVNNFSAGIRKTQGGTLRLTEQLILTGQSQENFREVSNDLLSQSGKNYDALSKLNDAVLETAEKYALSTDKLLEGVSRVMKEANNFSVFGPEVAAKIGTESAKVLGQFKGLNEGQLTKFFQLLKPGLEGRATRELFDLQPLQNDIARGNVSSENIISNIDKVSTKITQLIDQAGGDADVAVEMLKAYGISNEMATAMIGMGRTVQASKLEASNDASKLRSTQEEQKNTIKNQTELANKYYESIAPKTLDATVALLQPALLTAQAVNVLATAGQGAGSVTNMIGDLFGGGKGKVGKLARGSGVLTPKGAMGRGGMMNVGRIDFNNQTKSFTGSIKNLTNTVKNAFSPSKLKDVFSGLSKNPIASIGIGTAMQAGAGLIPQGEDNKVGQAAAGALENAGAFAEYAGMAQMLGMAGKLTPQGMVLAGATALIDPLTEAMGAEKGDNLDSTGDVAKFAAAGAAIGSFIPIPGVGTGVGALIGAGAGLVSEYLDWDGERAVLEEKTAKELEKTNEELRQAKEIQKQATMKSDFALMSIVTRVQSQQTEFLKTASAEQIAAFQELTTEFKGFRQETNVRESGKKSEDMNK